MKNSYQKQFDLQFWAQGGRFDISGLPQSDLLAIIENSRGFAEHKIQFHLAYCSQYRPLPHIHFDFVTNTLVDACALVSKRNDVGFIGLNIGTTIVLFDLFYRMLSYKEAFPGIGNREVEVLTAPTLRQNICDMDELRENGSPSFMPTQYSFPIDTTRRAYAFLLSSLSIHFLINHEIAHIIFGHCEYIDRKAKRRMIKEVNDIFTPTFSKITAQTLEYDADCFGTSQEIFSLIQYVNDPNKVSESWRWVYESFELAISTWFLSVYMLFRLFGFTSDLSHPKPSYRASIAQVTGYEAVKKWAGEEKADRYIEVTANAIKLFEETYALITGITSDFTWIKEAYLPEGQKRQQEYMDHWEVLKPELQKYAHRPLIQ